MTGKDAGGVAQQRSRASEDAARRRPRADRMGTELMVGSTKG